MRYFAATPENYASARDQIDAALGYPSTTGGIPTESFMPIVADAPKDVEGRCLIALRNMEFAEPEVQPVMSSNLFEEITAEAYEASISNDSDS